MCRLDKITILTYRAFDDFYYVVALSTVSLLGDFDKGMPSTTENELPSKSYRLCTKILSFIGYSITRSLDATMM